jgi:predicted Zn-dependent peptidase
MKIHKRDIPGIELFYLPNKKFKTIDFAFVFTNKFVDEELNERQFLTEILTESTQKYRNSEQMSLVCDNLYGIDKACSYNLSGDVGITTVLLRCINEKYLDEEGITDKALNLLIEMIYNPKKNKGLIPLAAVKDQKNQTEQFILSIKQNKTAYAYYEFMKHFTKDFEDKVGIFPRLNHLSKVDNLTVTKVYEKMIKEDRLQIFVSGDFDFEKMDEFFKKHQLKTNVLEGFEYLKNYGKRRDLYEVLERSSNGQTRIYLGYYLDFLPKKNNVIAMKIFDELFGGFEYSRLFVNIREKLQLSYYVYSRYNEDNNLFFVGLETSKNNAKKAISEIDSELKKCQQGEISEELFLQAKTNIIKRIEAKKDSQTAGLIQSIVNFLKYGSEYSEDEMLRDLEIISIDDVLSVIRRISLDTVYIYTNEE